MRRSVSSIHTSMRPCAGDIAVRVADFVRLAQACRQHLVVFAQFGEHVRRFDIFGVVVGDALGARDMADRTQNEPPSFFNALGGGIGHGVYLLDRSSSITW